VLRLENARIERGLLRQARYDSGVTAGDASAKWGLVKTVFLDRDGVLNRKAPEGEYIARWEDFEILDGVIEALGRLRRAGVRTIAVTNQRGVALGRYSLPDVEALHAKLQQILAASGAQMDAIYVCPHDRGECNCRKPLPGLFEQAAGEHPGLSARECVMIGDSLVDMEFGRRLGMRTILIEEGDNDRAIEREKARHLADFCCASLEEAVDQILGQI
jgi:D-glycero-D-manno-heptose 1,7-bisphosphate phosphatase